MVLYKSMFRAILTHILVRDLEIEILGVLPALVGTLGAVAGDVPRRAYAWLTIRLGSAVTFKASPCTGRCTVTLFIE